MPTVSSIDTSFQIRGPRRWRVTPLTLVVAVGIAGAVGRATLAQGPSVEATPDSASLRVEVSLKHRSLRLIRGDERIATYPIAIGRRSMPTPRGNYEIQKIVWNPAWIPPDREWARNKKPQKPGAPGNPMKVVKMFFREPAYYIHGTGDTESLGDAASHGCLRMDPDDAYRVARYLMEHGGSPRDESWFSRVLHFRRETKTVYLDNPIPMSVD
ncbi:MAG TPA: L,D-transpeptidase [Gemmatimonadaceae bacterium]